MKKLSLVILILVGILGFSACGDSKDSKVESSVDLGESQKSTQDSQVESSNLAQDSTQSNTQSSESNADSTTDSSANPQDSNAQSSTNPAIAIKCGEREFGYEDSSQKCIITGSNSIEEAIKAHLQSEISDDYEVLRRINKTISTIKLPNDNVKVEHQIQVCLNDEITDCELTSMWVFITRKSKDEIVIEYDPSALFYQKTYKQTQNGVEVIDKYYI
ncbi:hypothetical protein [Helicobacter sp. T3_23-1056]